MLAWLTLPVPFAASPVQAGNDAVRTLAVIPPGFTEPAFEAAWRKALTALEEDLLLPLRDEDQVRGALASYQARESELLRANEAGGLAHQGRVREALDEAWQNYYRLDFKGSLDLLEESGSSLDRLTDPEAAADLIFERAMLAGMNRRALDLAEAELDFMAAAAVAGSNEPTTELYSPDIITAYRHARRSLLNSSAATFSVKTDPADAEVYLDGVPAMTGNPVKMEIKPGRHVLNIRAPGYRDHLEIVDMGNWENRAVEVALEPGLIPSPEGAFLAGRLLAGDRRLIANLASVVDADLLLLPGQVEGALKAWIVDDGGNVLSETTLAGEGVPGNPSEAMTALMKPFRVPLREMAGDDPRYEAVTITQPEPVITEAAEKNRSRWLYVLGGVLVLALAAGGGDGGGGGTTVVATW
jgi:hypothetical protein